MEEIINNIMQSPENTNPNVLRSQLQNIGSSGSDGGIYLVSVTMNPETGAFTADKTFEEIYAAVISGAYVVGRINNPDGVIYDFPLVSATNHTLVFQALDYEATPPSAILTEFYLQSDNTWSMHGVTFLGEDSSGGE